MPSRTTRRVETARCRTCRRRTPHDVSIGPLQLDPKHPGDRKYAFQPMTYRCTVCGREQRTRRLPNLLASLFHR